MNWLIGCLVLGLKYLAVGLMCMLGLVIAYLFLTWFLALLILVVYR